MIYARILWRDSVYPACLEHRKREFDPVDAATGCSEQQVHAKHPKSPADVDDTVLGQVLGNAMCLDEGG